MSQGMFGIVGVQRGTDSYSGLSERIGVFLKDIDNGKGRFSCLLGDYYVMGMKRLTAGGAHEQTEIHRDGTDGAICLLHGEVNNYHELIATNCNGSKPAGDLDLISSLYRKEGPAFVKRLNGLFSIAVLDEKNRTVVLLNDRFGMAHQIYWLVTNGRLCFATHLKTLLSIPGIRKEIDEEALNLFLKYSYITSPWSILRGISKLPPGSMLTFRDGKAEVIPHWTFAEPSNTIRDPEEAVCIYRDLLKRAVQRRLGNNGDVGVLLSGGLDSSANVALGAGISGTPIKTFSIGFDNEAFDERPYARMVARHYGTEHHEYAITGDEIEDLPRLIYNLEEPYFEFGLFLTYLGLAAAQGRVGAVIGGEGADQLFGTGGFAKGMPAALYYVLKKSRLRALARAGGKLMRGPLFYEKDNVAFKLRLLWNRATDLNDWYFYGYDECELRHVHRNPLTAGVPRIFPDRSVNGASSFADLFHGTQVNQDLRHYVNENVMVKSGRMADMFDLTLRESYLDTEVTDFLLSLDLSLKRSGGLFDHLRGSVTTKLLHRMAVSDLLPQEVLSKPKQGGFVPVMIFLKDPQMRRRIYNHLLDSEIISGYFDTGYLTGLFESYEKMQGRKVYWANFHNSKANRILFLLTFDIWHYLYIRRNPLTTNVPSLSDYITQQ